MEFKICGGHDLIFSPDLFRFNPLSAALLSHSRCLLFAVRLRERMLFVSRFVYAVATIGAFFECTMHVHTFLSNGFFYFFLLFFCSLLVSNSSRLFSCWILLWSRVHRPYTKFITCNSSNILYSAWNFSLLHSFCLWMGRQRMFRFRM